VAGSISMAKPERWPRYQNVIFDCDSTLSRVEGIDQLANHPDTVRQVVDLTNAAMDGQIELRQVYGKRLNILKPTRGALRLLKQAYKKHQVPDADRLIVALKILGHDIYIVSGGLLDPVREFGLSLGINSKNIRAVAVEFDELSGDWWRQHGSQWEQSYLDYTQSDLAESDGKARIIEDLLANKQGRSLLVGDGVSDLLARHAVNLFVGFGGVVQRQRVRDEADVYIESESLAPLLLLAGGSDVSPNLDNDSVRSLKQTAHQLIASSALHFNNTALQQKFRSGFAIPSDKKPEHDLEL